MSIGLYDSFGDIPLEARAAETETIFDSEAWLKLIEAEPALAPLYFVAQQAGPRFAILPTYRWDGTWSLFTQHYDSPFTALARLLRSDPSAYLPTLFLGSVGGYTNKLPFLRRLFGDHAALSELTARCLQHARAEGVRSISIPYSTSAAVAIALDRIPSPMTLLATEPAAYLNVTWSSLDGYVQDLPSKRRWSVRKEVSAVADCGHHPTVEPLAPWVDRIAPLLADLQRRHGLPDEVTSIADQLRRIAGALGEAASVVVIASPRGVVGFGLLLESGDDLYSYKVGFVEAEARECATYFNVLFYLPLDYAIQRHLRRIHFGITGAEAKLLRGAQVEARWSVIMEPAIPTQVARAWNELQLRKHQDLVRRFGGVISAADRDVFERTVDRQEPA